MLILTHQCNNNNIYFFKIISLTALLVDSTIYYEKVNCYR